MRINTILKSLTVMTVLLGNCVTVSAANTVTEGFDNFKAGWNSSWTDWELTLPEGWDCSGAANNFARGDTYKTAVPSIEVSGSNTDAYLITPALTGEFSFYIRNYTKNYQASVTAYACTFESGTLNLGTELGTQTLQKTSSGVPTWEQVAFTAPSAGARVALLISRAYFDDFTYTPSEGGSDNPEPAPVMVVSTTTVNFGKVAANATQDIIVSNSGNAELTATIASNSDEFTVSKSNVTIPAGEQETFTITFLYHAEAYGGHTASITLTPNAGETATIAVSAYVQNPNVWTEDFSSDVLPEGWDAGDCWTFSDGVAHGKYVYNANNYLTTPALVVDGIADQLTFQARQTGIYPDIKIEQSLNGGAWSSCKTIKSDDISETWTNFTIEGLAAGSYQFRFLSDSYDLDNFEGFRLNMDAPMMVVSPDTNAAFGKVSAQPEAMTYSIANTGTGTLTGTITSSDETMFTVSKSEFSLAAGESTTFDIALVFDEHYGPKSATITVHPSNEGVSDVVISATATTLDPNVWAVDFEEGVIPEDWTNSGWTVGTLTGFDNDTPMALAPQSTTAMSLTTPRLQAEQGNELTWDAYLRWNDESLLIQYSNDEQATWTTIYDYKAEDEGQEDRFYKAMSFTAPADGYYYLRFTSKMQNGIDNLKGFKLAPSTETSETWYVTYTFYYPDEGGEWQSMIDTEEMEVTYDDGNKISFNFPNPVTGNAWLRGTKDGEGNIVFPSGQYIAKYGSDNAYYCGTDGEKLTDMTFYYNADSDSYLCTGPLLINSSQTQLSYWFYFVNVLVGKNLPATGMTDAIVQKSEPRAAIYDLQGRRVTQPKRGLYIVNGRVVVIK